MSKQYVVAIVGATGAIGQVMLEVLEARDFPISRLHLLASARSARSVIEFRGEKIEVEDVKGFNFSAIDIGLFSAGASTSAQYAPIAAAAGCVVIDNTSQFRNDPEIPLVIPEVNPQAVSEYTVRNIIANPNCSTIQMLVAIKPIYDAVGVSRINVVTYQSVSGSGKAAIDELTDQTHRLLHDQAIEPPEIYPKQIAFNVIPQLDVFLDNGYTKEEMKMVNETKKILSDDEILVNPTAVRVPVLFGHSEAIHLETRAKITAAHARDLLTGAAGVHLCPQGEYPTPALGVAGSDAVFVGRVREDISTPLGLDLWVVSDNRRKGGALNSVQIAELLAELR
jgi:aspartate-semialdehyde dehydrogenase